MVEYKSNVWQIKGLRYCSKNNKMHWEISQPMMASIAMISFKQNQCFFLLLTSVQMISPKIWGNFKEIWLFSAPQKNINQ
jgi:hypothetical protein